MPVDCIYVSKKPQVERLEAFDLKSSAYWAIPKLFYRRPNKSGILIRRHEAAEFYTPGHAEPFSLDTMLSDTLLLPGNI